ncbi:hypothetical protein MKK69_30800 [Methylobacterium sp. J-026]|uniref:hypothetical protein n=1 Tax=Methylobacterium sp. J-026 TaxID=2836624 RepID=UPI001FB9A0D8|nr:hypothetical protein [Methylobacterium sp. J-026]MCJ2138394.1 hypothetical protein [Methylobacterium sp. J-026]
MPKDAAVQTMTQAQFAKHRKVTPKSVTKWKQAGRLVLTADGLIDVKASELLLDERPERYRGGVTQAGGNKPEVTPDLDDDGNLSLADAIRRKENYLGLQRKRDWEISNGEWVRVEDIETLVETTFRAVREKLLPIPVRVQMSMPPEVAQLAHDMTQKHLYEAMQEIYEDGMKTCNDIEDQAIFMAKRNRRS